MSVSLDAWLGQGEPLAADWGAHVQRLALRGELGSVGRLLLDLPALAAPYACASGACTPGRRAPRTRSCCADLDVELVPEEVAAITLYSEAIAATMTALDGRWRGRPPETVLEGVLSRPGRRCVFSVDEGEGLRCGLHRTEDRLGLPRGTVKPLPCRLFPLLVVDLGDTQLLTAISKANVKNGAPAPRWFPCLGGEGSPALVDGVADTLTEVWGARTAGKVRRAVAAYRAA